MIVELEEEEELVVYPKRRKGAYQVLRNRGGDIVYVLRVERSK